MEILLDTLKAQQYRVHVGFTNGQQVQVYDTKLARYVAEDVSVIGGMVQLPPSYNAYDAWLLLEAVQGIEQVTIVRPYTDINKFAQQAEVSGEEATKLERYARHIIDSQTRGFKYWQGIEELIGQGGDILPLPIRIVEPYRLWENGVLVYDRAGDKQVYIRPTRDGYGVIADVGPAPWRADRQSHNIQQYGTEEEGYFQFYYDYYLEGEFGYVVLPQAVQDAAVLLMKDLACGNISYTGSYVERFSNDIGSISLNKAAFAGTGNFIVDNMLEPYARTIGRMAII